MNIEVNNQPVIINILNVFFVSHPLCADSFSFSPRSSLTLSWDSCSPRAADAPSATDRLQPISGVRTGATGKRTNHSADVCDESDSFATKKKACRHRCYRRAPFNVDRKTDNYCN